MTVASLRNMRDYPVSYVIGALMVGLDVGYLIGRLVP